MSYLYTVNACGGGTLSAAVVVTTIALPNSGSDSTLVLCPTDSPIDLYNYLGGSPETGGTWSPALASGTGVFDPMNDAANTYTYTLNNPCGSSNNSVVVVINNCDSAPIALFNVPNIRPCINDCINFLDQSNNNPTSYLWYFPGATPNTSTDQNPLNICYNSIGSFDVKLVVQNIEGKDSLTLPNYITVDSCNIIPTTVIIPNVLSPNGDGKNDLFNVSGTGIISVKINIFNRWGSLLFNTDGISNIGWDGRTSSGNELAAGTYFYIIDVETAQETKTYKGALTLIR